MGYIGIMEKKMETPCRSIMFLCNLLTEELRDYAAWPLRLELLNSHGKVLSCYATILLSYCDCYYITIL